MARLTPGEAAAKWRDRTSAAQQDYVRGVERVTVSPGQLAARQRDKYLIKVQQNVDKFVRNSARVTREAWVQAAVEKGAQRLAGGVAAAAPKMEAFMAEVMPHIDRGRQQLAQMPSVSEADSEQRALFWMRHMRSFRRPGGVR